MHFDKDSHVLIMQDMGALPSLKSWLQTTSPAEQIASIGRTLGNYLADFHNNDNAAVEAWFGGGDGDGGDSSSSDSKEKNNVVGRNLSASVYFSALPDAAAKYGYTDPWIAAAAKAAEVEVLTAKEVWTLGDFWTGNILVSAPDDQSVPPKVTVLDFELLKPGTAAFDVGQMGAEMFCLALFRCPEQGYLLLRTFFRAYRAERKGVVDAAAVAVRIGAHLFTIMPRAWTADYGEEKVRLALQRGFELLKIGWERDEAALRKSIVGVLME